MIVVKILGSGCANCKRLEQIVRQIVEKENMEAEILKVTDFDEIMKYPIWPHQGWLSTKNSSLLVEFQAPQKCLSG